MRCRKYNCEYNDDGYCRQPDYVVIDENGQCDQMFVREPVSSVPEEIEED